MMDDPALVHGVATVSLALQRDPSFATRVLHELRSSPDLAPDLLAVPAVHDDENVRAVMQVSPVVIDRHVHGVGAIVDALAILAPVMPWASVHVSNVMLSLLRGFFPRVSSPNALYLQVLGAVERGLVRRVHGDPAGLLPPAKEVARLAEYAAMVEDMWRLRFPRLAVKIGPVAPQDLLVTVSPYDDMVVVHPSAFTSPYWPSILVHALALLLLHDHHPRMHPRFKEQLAILTCRAAIGEALLAPGKCASVMGSHPVDHAQYQVSRIARDLDQYGDFDHKLLHMFPDQGIDENYSDDMIAALVLFLLDEHAIDERDLFARVSASSAGYKSFANTYLSFVAVLGTMEKWGLLRREGTMLVVPGMEDAR